MVQIIGINLDLAMEELDVKADKKFQAEPDHIGVSLQVWELSDEDFAFICNINDEDWLEEHGWWINGGCNHPKDQVTLATINGKKLKAFVEEPSDYDIIFEYVNLSDYFDSHIGISKYNNIAYYIHSLAELNEMTKSDFMKKFW